MDINKAEVLRYLGYRGQEIDGRLNGMIDSCIEELMEIAEPRSVYKVFDIEASGGEIRLKGSNVVFRGRDICRHLENSPKCAVLAATLGIQVDNRIRALGKTDAARAVILDSCGTEAIESLCGLAEAEIREIAGREGFEINYRYSPGYGDFSIDVQPDILRALNAQARIGLTCTESFILLPRKSVTAVTGFVKESAGAARAGCEGCKAYGSCSYRRDGMNCGF